MQPSQSGARQFEGNDANHAQQAAALGRRELAEDSASSSIGQEKQANRGDQLASSSSTPKSHEASWAANEKGYVMLQEELECDRLQAGIEALSLGEETQERDGASEQVEYAGLLDLPFELLLHIFSIFRPSSITTSEHIERQSQSARNCLICKSTLPSAQVALYSRPTVSNMKNILSFAATITGNQVESLCRHVTLFEFSNTWTDLRHLAALESILSLTSLSSIGLHTMQGCIEQLAFRIARAKNLREVEISGVAADSQTSFSSSLQLLARSPTQSLEIRVNGHIDYSLATPTWQQPTLPAAATPTILQELHIDFPRLSDDFPDQHMNLVRLQAFFADIPNSIVSLSISFHLRIPSTLWARCVHLKHLAIREQEERSFDTLPAGLLSLAYTTYRKTLFQTQPTLKLPSTLKYISLRPGSSLDGSAWILDHNLPHLRLLVLGRDWREDEEISRSFLARGITLEKGIWFSPKQWWTRVQELERL